MGTIEAMSLSELLDQVEAAVGRARAGLADEHEADVRHAVVDLGAFAHRAQLLVTTW